MLRHIRSVLEPAYLSAGSSEVSRVTHITCRFCTHPSVDPEESRRPVLLELHDRTTSHTPTQTDNEAMTSTQLQIKSLLGGLIERETGLTIEVHPSGGVEENGWSLVHGFGNANYRHRALQSDAENFTIARVCRPFYVSRSPYCGLHIVRNFA